MLRVAFDRKVYWAGLHDALGIIVYDKRAQKNVPSDCVCLFVHAERSMKTFAKAVVRSKLSRIESHDREALVGAVRLYHNLQVTSVNESAGYQFVATSQSVERVFHRSTCGWMRHVSLSSLITFSNKEAAMRRGYSPCKSCHP
jgi:hypothetical protein